MKKKEKWPEEIGEEKDLFADRIYFLFRHNDARLVFFTCANRHM